MARRIRTTKKLAQRIDRGYFKRTFAIPYWRRVLSIGLTLVGLLWLGWSLLSGKQAYSAGPLAHAHKIVGNNCQSCHAQEATWGTRVGDMACVTCHDAPAHQASQTFTPECVTCHVEHQSSFRLAATSNAACTQCHSDLKVKDGKTRFTADIRSFSNGHPEFAAVRPGHAPDPGTIKLNHQVHLKAGLAGPNGTKVQMVCTDCHHEGVAAPRPGPPGEAVAAPVTTAALMTSDPAQTNLNTRSLSPEILPVTFDRDCKSCHPLSFDTRFNDPAPHTDAKVVDEYVRDQYTKYIAAHPGEVHQPVQLNPGLPSRPVPPAPRNASEWVSQRVEEADRLLFQKDCKECHQLTYPAPLAPPDVPKANTTTHWMKNASFDHKAHQLVGCAECHTQAAKSEKTEDVLLPNIATCQKCHNDSASAAGTGCYECHVYHDWSKAKPVKNAATISQILR